jgi:hypothetical protein
VLQPSLRPRLTELGSGERAHSRAGGLCQPVQDWFRGQVVRRGPGMLTVDATRSGSLLRIL